METKLPYKNMNYKIKNKHKGFLALGAASYLFLLITVEIILFLSITVIGRGKENAINRVHLKSAFEKAYLIEKESDLPLGLISLMALQRYPKNTVSRLEGF